VIQSPSIIFPTSTASSAGANANIVNSFRGGSMMFGGGMNGGGGADPLGFHHLF